MQSTAVLLRKQADDPALSGMLRYDTHGGSAGIDFRFEVVRIWERPASALLSGGLGMVAWILIGMRVPRSTSKQFQEAMSMVDLRDSSTYQLIREEGLAEGMAKGMAEGLRTMLPQIGGRRFGSPTAEVQESLDAVDDVARLRRMGERVLDAATWQDLLDTP